MSPLRLRERQRGQGAVWRRSQTLASCEGLLGLEGGLWGAGPHLSCSYSNPPLTSEHMDHCTNDRKKLVQRLRPANAPVGANPFGARWEKGEGEGELKNDGKPPNSAVFSML